MEIPLIDAMRSFIVASFDHAAVQAEYKRAQVMRAANIRSIEASFDAVKAKFTEVEFSFKSSCLSWDLTPLQINGLTNICKREATRLNKLMPGAMSLADLFFTEQARRSRRKARRALLTWNGNEECLNQQTAEGWFGLYDILPLDDGEECLNYKLMYGEECLIEKAFIDECKAEAEDNERDERIDREGEARMSVARVRLLTWDDIDGTAIGKNGTEYKVAVRADGRWKIMVDGETEGAAATEESARDMADVIEHQRTTDTKAELEAAGLFTGR